MTVLSRSFCLCSLLLRFTVLIGSLEASALGRTIMSQSSGLWSDATTWKANQLPSDRDDVVIQPHHHVILDQRIPSIFRLIHVRGTLEFSHSHDTELNVCLMVVTPLENAEELVTECHAMSGGDVPATSPFESTLLVGRPDAPIEAGKRAAIRLHALPGMNEENTPGLVCCGGRLELHGAPLGRSWLKLKQTTRPGDRDLFVSAAPVGWQNGDRLLITRTRRRIQREDSEPTNGSSYHEIRQLQWPTGIDASSVASTYENQPSASHANSVHEPVSNGAKLTLDKPLDSFHDADEPYCGEVANLSRNVVIESADPQGVRGHTMYHRHSRGSIRFAEFRHLGKRNVLGRYPIHFHLVANTMRGALVEGASIWDSHNRWIAIHGTNYLVVRDCVGYQSVGHGYFLEDGSETFNVLDHNLAVSASRGEPLPKQVLSFDSNGGSGFWWAHCHNSFTRNTAVDCDEYGFRFEVKRTDQFSPVLSIQQANGTQQAQDIRSRPFIQFAHNEVHSAPAPGLNLRGISRPTSMIYDQLNQDLLREGRESMPDRRYPFWVSQFRAWDCEWAFHSGTGGVFLDGLDASRVEYGIWRSVLDRHVWRNISFRDVRKKDLHMPFTFGVPFPDEEDPRNLEYLTAIQGFVDDFAPATVIHTAQWRDQMLVVQGSTVDCSDVRRVTVNGIEATPTDTNFRKWQAVLPAPLADHAELTALAEDIHGNCESNPHRIAFPRQ